MGAAGPENRPTAPPELLLLPRTPTDAHYRRNHFPYPEVDPGTWTLEVGGEVDRPFRLDLTELRGMPRRELVVLLECAGHRRTEFDPPVAGVPWETGAMGQAEWAGTPLRGLLERAGLRSRVVEIVLHGADRGPFQGLPGEHSFSRSLPLARALHPDTLIAWEMNSEPLPAVHGAPARAIVPGWYAMDSVKWLTRIEATGERFRGAFQERDYRFQRAGEEGIGRRLTEIPVHSLLLDPAGRQPSPAGARTLSGIAWGGRGGIASVEVRVDGAPWRPARLTRASGPYEASRWDLTVDLAPGEHEVAVRATDGAGVTQPESAEWNRRGYANNGIHRTRLRCIDIGAAARAASAG